MSSSLMFSEAGHQASVAARKFPSLSFWKRRADCPVVPVTGSESLIPRDCT